MGFYQTWRKVIGRRNIGARADVHINALCRIALLLRISLQYTPPHGQSLDTIYSVHMHKRFDFEMRTSRKGRIRAAIVSSTGPVRLVRAC